MKSNDLTLREVYVIETIVSGEYNPNNYNLPNYELSYEQANAGAAVWTRYCQDGGAMHGEKTVGKAFAAVCSSLKKKGYLVNEGKGEEAVMSAMDIGTGGVYILRTTRICSKMDEDEAFDKTVRDSLKKFNEGDWGHSLTKEANDEDTKNAMGIYNHGPIHFAIHRSNEGRRVTVSFIDERP